MFFDSTFEFMEENFENEDGIIFVHCAFGKSRSASIVFMYIMKKYEWTFERVFLVIFNQKISYIIYLIFIFFK